jgi:hypothetical protein
MKKIFKLYYDNGTKPKIINSFKMRELEPIWASECLYIGLRDINKKRIFEKDIIRIDNGSEIFIGPVIYNKERACFDIEHPKGYQGHWGLTKNIIEVCKYKVIGNTIENSNLLK